MTCLEIIHAHLKSIGADGLCRDGCGCAGDVPCGEDFSECIPARRRVIPKHGQNDDDRRMISEWDLKPGDEYYTALEDKRSWLCNEPDQARSDAEETK